MQKILTCVILLLALSPSAQAIQETASIEIPNMRIYSVKAIESLHNAHMDLLAAGQVRQDQQDNALIIALSPTKDQYQEMAREVFSLAPKGNACKTRIRSLVCIRGSSPGQCLVIVNGKAGPENQEIGFLRSYVLTPEGFTLADHREFHDPAKAYTHGYPLLQEDINGDGKNEIIYGGFSGTHDRDTADIRIFEVRKQGKLSRIEHFQKHHLESLPLRVNALASGDLDGNGSPEIVAAGRTVTENVEHAALVVFSEDHKVWKILRELKNSRYRYATITDLTGDGQQDLVLGGRITLQGSLYALVDIWQVAQGALHLKSRFCFTGAGSTRLRLVEPLPTSSKHLIIGGRLEALGKDHKQWKGFLQEMSYTSGVLSLSSIPRILAKSWETRVRTFDISEQTLFVAGFAKKKHGKSSSAFIRVYQLQ
jgi:hypothetical protein